MANRILVQALLRYKKWVAIGLVALVIVDALEVVPPLLLKAAIDHIEGGFNQTTLIKLSLLYFLVAIAQAACRYVWRMTLIRASFWSAHDLRNNLVEHLVRLSQTFFDKRKTGDLMSHVLTDVEAIRMALGPGLLTLADALFYFLTIPSIMIFISWKLALLTFVLLPLIPVIVIKREKLIHSKFIKVQEAQSGLSSLVHESFSGIRVIKSFGMEKYQENKMQELASLFVDRSISLARTQSSFAPSMDFVMSLSLVLLIYFGGNQVLLGTLTLGGFVAFSRYIQKMVWPMTAIGLGITYYQRGLASAERVQALLGVPIDDSSDLKAPPAPYPKLNGMFQAKNLTFSYESNTNSNLGIEPALIDLNFIVEPGQKVAVVGRVGSGKTTLLSLFLKLYLPKSGQLFLDSIDIINWPTLALRKQMSFVGQEAFLFRDTIRKNIDYRSTDDMRLLIEASNAAEISNEIVDSLGGYDSMADERGLNFSGGQRQRITIARALISKPSVLILDDALSALDSRTERSVLSNIKQHNQRTLIISSNRLSQVQDADQILVLNQGRLVQSGSHQQLVKSKGSSYWLFCEQQKIFEELNEA